MKYILFLLMSFASLFLFAQKKGSEKLYAYKQAVIPGIRKKTIDDATGKEINEPLKPVYNYFIYMTSSSSISPVELWIDAKPYSVKVETVSKTPVEFKRDNIPGRKTLELVPKTTGKVIQLTPASDNEKESGKARTLAATNECVVLYKMNEKLYYLTQKKFSELESAVLQ